MICTEEEAEKKWCPHGRTGGVVYADETETWHYISANICELEGNAISLCCASRCMMWVPTEDGLGSCGLSRG